jgi:hypothetical protein
LRALPLPIDERLSLDGDLRMLTAIEPELAALDKLTAITAHRDGQIQLLMTLPGVNFIGAVGLLAALGDITRFKDGDHAAAYLGLTPSTHQSGKRCYHGHITKAGSNHARWLLNARCSAHGSAPGAAGSLLPPPSQATQSECRDCGHGTEVGDNRLSDAKTQRTLSLRQTGTDTHEVSKPVLPGNR